MGVSASFLERWNTDYKFRRHLANNDFYISIGGSLHVTTEGLGDYVSHRVSEDVISRFVMYRRPDGTANIEPLRF